jgi:pantoate kinase
VIKTFLSQFAIPDNYRINVEHQVEVPIGAGFGTSGAAALSLALALNDVFELGMSDTEAAQIAHTAEIKCKTGLGTVIAEASGGLEVRIKPGAPGIGEIKKIPVQEDYMIVCLISGPLPTKEFLTNAEICKRVNGFGGELINGIIERPSVSTFMHSSRQFAERTDMITDRIRKVLDIVDKHNIICSMPMFGETVFTIIEEEYLQQILAIFNTHNSDRRILVSAIDFEGARLVA